MFRLLKLLIQAIFHILGIPNPSYDVDSVLVLVFLLVYVAAIPAMWFWDELDVFGKVGGTAFLTVILAICLLSARSKIRAKKANPPGTQRDARDKRR